MSWSNSSPRRLSTTNNQSTDMSPGSYERESDESDESQDLSLMQDGVSPAPTCSEQREEQLCPVISITEAESCGSHCYKPNSPAASYTSMGSEQSMNPPLKFSQGPDVLGIYKAPSPAPTLASVQSEQSMDPLATFSCRESYSSLMMKDHLRCSVCKDMLKEPVSIPCGHSFCKPCILFYWNKPAHAGSSSCPQCRKRFKTRPALNLNLTLANVVQTQQQATLSPALLTQSDAGPGDVACDICSRSKFRAVKSCLTCCASYCEIHVRQHYTVEALQRHTLIEPTKDLEQEVYKLDKTNSPSEVIPKDLMRIMMEQMKQVQKEVNKITMELEDLRRCVPEPQPTGKRIHTQLDEEFVSQVCDFTVPDQQFPQE